MSRLGIAPPFISDAYREEEENKINAKLGYKSTRYANPQALHAKKKKN
jgi:hypothetical protein